MRCSVDGLRGHQVLSILSCAAQVEIDYKSECMAGQTVESLGSSTAEDTNGSGVLR